jgi:hypothetical protein
MRSLSTVHEQKKDPSWTTCWNMGRFPKMSGVVLWSAISRVAKQHISAWRAVVAVMLLGLTVVAGCDDVRPFCDVGGSCSSDEMDENGGGGEGTITLVSNPEEIDAEVNDVVDVRVQVDNRVRRRTYSFTITERPTRSGQIENESIDTDPDMGILTFRFEATTPTNFDTDTIEISVRDSASEEGSLVIDVSVDPDSDPDGSPPVVP